VTPSVIACDTGYTSPPQGTVTVSASDNRGVDRVEIRWTGVVTGQGLMSVGNPSTFIFNPPDGNGEGTVTFRIVAFDAAGNASAERTVDATVECLG
jgi:hypothetical protein